MSIQHTSAARASPPSLSQIKEEIARRLIKRKARGDFCAFRTLIADRNFIKGYWQHVVSIALQKFYEDYVAGLRPKIVLMAPPQHGKSVLLRAFIAWFAGKQPDKNIIFGSYSDDLGVKLNLGLQRIMSSEEYRRAFPDTLINDGSVTGYLRNTSLLQFVGREGSFRNTTVGGQITGQSLDLGVVDDPIKGRAEANSETIRNKTWEWLTDDFFSRFSDSAAFILTMTRWHLDDPAGRLLERYPDVKVLRFTALAEKDDWLGRQEGEPLFPELKSLEFLRERKAFYTEASWQSLYQQNPIIVGGGLFPIEKFKTMQAPPAREDIRETVRYWDKAGTEDGGAFTAGVLMHALHDGRYVVSDVQSGQWSALDREQRIRRTSEIDSSLYAAYAVWIEQEPGSGGKGGKRRVNYSQYGRHECVCRARDRLKGRARRALCCAGARRQRLSRGC